MKEFLYALARGADERTASKASKETLRILEQLRAVTKHKNIYYLNDGFVCGKIDISSNGTGYLAPFDSRFKFDLIIENKDLNSAHLGDVVLARLIKFKGDRAHAKVLAVLAQANATSVVYTKKIGAAILGVNISNGLALCLRASQKSLKQLPLGAVLKVSNATNDVVEVLGVLSDPAVDEKISLALYDKRDEFPRACDVEAASWGDEVDKELYPSRVDLTALPFCTIDPDDAKDFDDAIYYDEAANAVYVAIADVSEYVAPYTGIDKEAKFRGFSIYFPHKSVPMLPRGLSENICSLKPNLNRLAFVFKITLDSNLNPSSEELFEAIIKSRRRFTYNEIDAFLAGESKIEPGIAAWLAPLSNLTSNLKKKRLEKGFDFRSRELRMSLNDEGEITATKWESDTPSHALIEDCMLLANRAAAKRIKKGIFRNHAPADLKKITKLLEDLASLGIEATYETNLAKMIAKIQAKADAMGIREDVDKLVIKAQKRAEYAPTPSGHFGLGFDFYTHFTSPIRRYSDLLLHRLLKSNLNNDAKFFNYLLLGIEETCAELNRLEREADRVAWDFMDRKFARFFASHVGESFRCYISEVGATSYAKLDDELKGARIYLDAFVGDLLAPVLVRIESVDIGTAKITGKVVKKLDV